MLTRAAGATVMEVWPEIPLPGALAVICAAPVEIACANPFALMDAMPVLLEVHCTVAVMFCVVPSV